MSSQAHSSRWEAEASLFSQGEALLFEVPLRFEAGWLRWGR